MQRYLEQYLFVTNYSIMKKWKELNSVEKVEYWKVLRIEKNQ